MYLEKNSGFQQAWLIYQSFSLNRYIIYQASLASGRDEVLIPMLEELKNQNVDFLFRYQILQSPLTPVKNPALIPAMLVSK